ncbi:MAG: methyltransferase domain-containing protein [Actinobacteria bacterium]|nr:methyltransferase domain-containing protein [Actinomycetota bacterium]
MRIDPSTFESAYARSGDPWDFDGSPYEQRRYDLTVAALPRTRYRRCFEPGCSIGVLTERLAEVADEVIGCDPSPSAVASASERLAAHGAVTIEVGSLPQWWPEGTFDLLVFSELGYYWDLGELDSLVERLHTLLRPEAHVVAVHWLGESPDHLLSGEQVHDVLRRRFGPSAFRHASDTRAAGAGFLLERWELRR